MAVISIDLGGTKIKAGIISKDFEVLSSIKIPTNPQYGKAKLLASLKLIIGSLIGGSKHKITAITISMPGYSNIKGKLVAVGNVLSFLEGFNLKSYLEKYFSLPVLIHNDAICFTIAESIFGAGKTNNIVLGVIWGSGIGASLVSGLNFINRKNSRIPYFGKSNSAIEFGHSYVYDIHSKKFTELELLSGGAFLTKRYLKLGGKISNPTVGDIYRSKEVLAKDLIKETFQLVGMSLANLVNCFNPDVIVLGGGVAKLPLSAYKKLFTQIKKYSLKNHSKNLTLKRFEVSDDEGILGAAYFSFGK